MLRRKRQMRCSSRQCCALNAKWAPAIANVARQTPNGVPQSPWLPRFAQPHAESRVAGLRGADPVFAAFFDNERDERALPLEVVPRRRGAAGG